jgi:CubicO group peptidase (beta-lactamase class C family)
MKIVRITLRILILLALICGFLYLNSLLPIITGYAAKNMSSALFVAKRTYESMEETDLNFSFIRFVNNKIDPLQKSVKSRFLWHTSRTTFVNGFGSILVNDYDVNEIHSRLYPVVPVLPENPESIPWPMGDLITKPIHSGINMEKLNLAMEQAFADTIPFKGTFAVMVVYKGQPIVEKYAKGFSADNLFLSWSMAKSFTNALTGILVKEGKLNIHEPADIDEWQNDERSQITINNLMQMNSGLEWNEDYGNSSDVNNMLHKKGDMAHFAIEKPLKFTPGTVFEYSSGSTNIVSYLMRKAIGYDSEYFAFPREKLFNKIGMRSAIFELDASGTFVGSSYLYASLRDYARFGLLYLNNGKWLGKQVLPNEWVEYSTTPAAGSDDRYGAFFWLNKSGVDHPDVPRDMYSCRGHDGQYIYIIPSKEMVIVRTGYSKKGEFDENRFIAAIIDAL